MHPVNKPLEKLPAKTHSGETFGYAFRVPKDVHIDIKRFAKKEGVTPDQYCKRLVLSNLNKKKSVKAVIVEQVAPPAPANYQIAKPQLRALFKHAAHAGLSKAAFEVLGAFVSILVFDNKWTVIRAKQVCTDSGPVSGAKLTVKLVDAGLIERRKIIDTQKYEYRLCTRFKKQVAIDVDNSKSEGV